MVLSEFSYFRNIFQELKFNSFFPLHVYTYEIPTTEVYCTLVIFLILELFNKAIMKYLIFIYRSKLYKIDQVTLWQNGIEEMIHKAAVADEEVFARQQAKIDLQLKTVKKDQKPSAVATYFDEISKGHLICSLINLLIAPCVCDGKPSYEQR